MDQMDGDNSKSKLMKTKDNNAIGAFVGQAYGIGVNMILGSSYNNTFKPLPFPNSQLLVENEITDNLYIQSNLHSAKKRIFLPNVPISLTITADRKAESIFSRNLPYIYTIALKHGGYEWEVIRNYKEFKDSFRALAEEVKKDLGYSCSDISADKIEQDWPMFPNEYDNIIPENLIDERCTQLVEYLKRVLTYPPFRDHQAVISLLGVSNLSFTLGLGKSYKESYLKRRTGDYVYLGNCCKIKLCCDKMKLTSEIRWFCLKETYLAYLDINRRLCFPLLVDMDFSIKKGIKTGLIHGISIKNSQRSLLVKCQKGSLSEWHDSIKEIQDDVSKEFCTEQRFKSFAPERKNQICKWFVNAGQYMETALVALNEAKEEIYITDWWFSPEIFLKRPTEDLQNRLDQVLLKKSRENVKIYVLLYKEFQLKIGGVELASTINLKSYRASCILTEHGKNPNIKVMRHPEHASNKVLLYSHHEKSIIIDQSIVFMGGVDLCFGRWDDDQHRLIDLGTKENKTDLSCSARNLIDSESVKNELIASAFSQPLVKRKNSSKEVTDDENIDGSIEDEVSENKWISAKNKLKYSKNKFKQRYLLSKMKSEEEEVEEEELELTENENIKPELKHVAANTQPQNYYWNGIDYCNVYAKDFQNIEEFDKDQFDREVTPRMPWRDQALLIVGEAARDVARHFIYRWNQCKYEKPNKDHNIPYLLPKSYKDGIQYDFSWFEKNFSHEATFNCNIQITRSMGKWSAGMKHTEKSILNAYIGLIESAEHFIYIENQFFVTTTQPGVDPDIKNGIGKALVNRIKQAHEENKKFRVYFVLPLLPGFDAKNAMMAVQYYNLRSIRIGKYSIYEDLRLAGIENPSDYITFHGMRNHDVLMNKLVQEIIYVHSKLMIVDDRFVICGSANINDRSLLGDRDSELAAIITDTEFIDSKFNNETVKVGKYAQSLRQKIFKLHLGIYFNNPKNTDVSDCTSDEFYNYFRETSKKNTETYDEVFKCIPSDNILKLQHFSEYSSAIGLRITNPLEAKKKMDSNVHGFLVDFPLKFLSREKAFFPSVFSLEGLLPKDMWT